MFICNSLSNYVLLIYKTNFTSYLYVRDKNSNVLISINIYIYNINIWKFRMMFIYFETHYQMSFFKIYKRNLHCIGLIYVKNENINGVSEIQLKTCLDMCLKNWTWINQIEELLSDFYLSTIFENQSNNLWIWFMILMISYLLKSNLDVSHVKLSCTYYRRSFVFIFWFKFVYMFFRIQI